MVGGAVVVVGAGPPWLPSQAAKNMEAKQTTRNCKRFDIDSNTADVSIKFNFSFSKYTLAALHFHLALSCESAFYTFYKHLIRFGQPWNDSYRPNGEKTQRKSTKPDPWTSNESDEFLKSEERYCWKKVYMVIGKRAKKGEPILGSSGLWPATSGGTWVPGGCGVSRSLFYQK
jgi:hypothetical protein